MREIQIILKITNINGYISSGITFICETDNSQVLNFSTKATLESYLDVGSAPEMPQTQSDAIVRIESSQTIEDADNGSQDLPLADTSLHDTSVPAQHEPVQPVPITSHVHVNLSAPNLSASVCA